MRNSFSLFSVVAVFALLGCDLPIAPRTLKETMTSLPGPTLSAAIAVPRNCNLELHSDRFAHPSFPWVRTSPAVQLSSGTLLIGANGVVDDGFAAPCHLTGVWSLEVTGRIVTGGQNYVFPKLHGQFSNGYWFIATSLPDGLHGWLLMVCNPESWLEQDVVPGHTLPEVCTENRWNLGGPPSVAEGEYMTLRVAANGTHLQLFAKHAGRLSFALAHEIPFLTSGLSVTRVGVSQPWDGDVELLAMRCCVDHRPPVVE